MELDMISPRSARWVRRALRHMSEATLLAAILAIHAIADDHWSLPELNVPGAYGMLAIFWAARALQSRGLDAGSSDTRSSDAAPRDEEGIT